MISDVFKSQQGRVAIAAYVLLVFAFAFGGASQLNALRLALVELAALPLLILAGSALAERPGLVPQHKFSLSLLGLALALPLVQLIPLPPAIWTRLPGHEDMALAQRLVNVSDSWVPISVTPDATWNAALALLPPVAMFLAVIVSGPKLVRNLVWICLFAVVANLIAGGLQAISGTTAFHPWPNTSARTISGLFANRNHLATLILCSMPLATWLAGESIRQNRSLNSGGTLMIGAYLALCLVGLAVGQSRFGLVMAFPVLALSLVVGWRSSNFERPRLALLGVISTGVVALTALVVLALPRALQRFQGPVETGRLDRWPFVIEAGNPFQPVGSGLGSFDPVYRAIEPLAQLDSTYFNQAHNEYLQIWLEAGVIGVVGLVAFFVWYGRRTWSAWRPAQAAGDGQRRAASVAILVVLMHSVVDYPLRTETILVLFALLCAILEGAGNAQAVVTPRSSADQGADERRSADPRETSQRVRKRVRVRR